jgi:hypothetical protein
MPMTNANPGSGGQEATSANSGTQNIRERLGHSFSDPITWFTLLLVIVGVLQWRTLDKTDQTLRLQQRAWLEFITMQLAAIPEKDQSIRFRIIYSNSGREPATDMNLVFDTKSIEPYDAKNIDLADLTIPENTICRNILPIKGRRVVAPTGTGYSLSAIYADTAHGLTRVVADDRFLRGEHFYVIQGCAAYNTQEVIRYSSFCFILDREVTKILQPPVPQPTPPLQSAPAVPELTNYRFESCASGFEAT